MRRMEDAHQQVLVTIPPSGDASISIRPLLRTPVSSAMIAKVGAAARLSQLAA
jgi:hypothetical protein